MSDPDSLRASLDSALRGRYEIVRLLGRGGMGAVYLAREQALDRLVAIKVLPPAGAAGKDARERFRREARTAARLSHPGIVPLLTFLESDGTLLYVMGYVRGESLAARLRREGRLSADETRRIVGEIADALDYAHRQGVVHRDIKPDNVLLDDESGRALLADFGIAKAQDAGATLTALGSVVGTPSYMSPEQAAGAATIDGRTDLYALGVMAYQMLSGSLPFDGATPRDVLVQHLSKEPPPLSRLAADAPSDLVAAVTRCLAKEPAARWPDARSLRAAVQWSGEEADHLAPGLESLDGYAGRLLVSVVVIADLLLVDFLWRAHLGPVSRESFRLLRLLVGLFAAAMVLGPAAVAPAIARSGIGWRAARRLAAQQPRWWRTWYPARLRRRGDVWDRLPTILKHARAATGLVFGLVLLLMPPQFIVMTSPAEDALRRNHPVLFAALRIMGAPPLLAMVYFFLVQFALAAWQKRRGVDSTTGTRLFLESTAHPTFWKRPDVAALLLPPAASRTTRTTSAEGPHELLREILEAARTGTGPGQPWATRAAAAARELLARCEALDRATAEAKKELDEEDLERVERRLAALGPDAEGEDPSRREMRRLLAAQADLARGWRARLEATRAERARLVGLLQDIRSALPGSDARLRALCEAAESRARAEAATTTAGRDALADLATLEATKEERS